MTLIYRRTGSFDQEELDEELVVMELESQSIVTLNPTGRLVWEMLDEAVTCDQIHDLIGSAFPDVDGNEVMSDIQAVLDTLIAARLVIPVSIEG